MFERGENRSQKGALLVKVSLLSRVDDIGVRSKGEHERRFRSMMESVEDEVSDLLLSMYSSKLVYRKSV